MIYRHESQWQLCMRERRALEWPAEEGVRLSWVYAIISADTHTHLKLLHRCYVGLGGDAFHYLGQQRTGRMRSLRMTVDHCQILFTR